MNQSGDKWCRPVTCAISAVFLLALCSCATTITTQRSTEGETMNRQTVLRFEFFGRVAGHSAAASSGVDALGRWHMSTGDTAEEVTTDPEVAKALTQGAVAGVLQSLSRIP